MPKVKKPIKGQISLIGEVLGLDLKYLPHKEVMDTGEAVVVLRIPPGAATVDKIASQQAAKEIAGKIKLVPNKFFFRKRPRNQY